MDDLKHRKIEWLLSQLAATMPQERVITDPSYLEICARDHTEDLRFYPDLVLQPVDTHEVSTVLTLCNEQEIPVTVRGAGTGLSGGCLPVSGGVVLDMKRMNRILNIDTENFQIITEPGVITEELQMAVEEKGLFYPVDPASRGSCFIGGNIAENSGGPRALKYGVTKDYVLNLEVVLPDGSVIWTGAHTLKNATGYHLTQLIIGSEGTLAVVTKIVLKLLPLPRHHILLWAPFKYIRDAAAAVNKIFLAGANPSALEFMEQAAVRTVQQYLGDDSLHFDTGIEAHLLIEIDGNDPGRMMEEAAVIHDVMSQFDTDEILFADTYEQQQRLWKIRRAIGEAVKSQSAYKEEDTVVPRAALPDLLAKVKELGRQFGFSSVCYGHAGDGNLHVNILKENLSDEMWKTALPRAIRILFGYVKELGGTISGEHGIGLVQQEYMDIVFPPAALKLMADIKKVFDPRNILNPGKIVPEPTSVQ